MLIRRQQLVFPSAAGSAGGPNFPSKLTMAAPLPRRLLNEPDEDESGEIPSRATHRQDHRRGNAPTVRNTPAAGADVSEMNLRGDLPQQ